MKLRPKAILGFGAFLYSIVEEKFKVKVLNEQESNGANIIQSTSKESQKQLFTAKEHRDGSYSFVNKKAGTPFDEYETSIDFLLSCVIIIMYKNAIIVF